MPPLTSMALSVVDLYLVKTGFILLNFNRFKNIYIYKIVFNATQIGFPLCNMSPFSMTIQTSPSLQIIH